MGWAGACPKVKRTQGRAGPTWDFQAGCTCQPRCGLRRRTHAQGGPSMEKVLSSRRCWNSDSRNLRTSPSPSASVDLPSTRPQRGFRGVLSAAYPLSPRRREIKTTNSLRCVDEQGRRGRGTLNHLFGIIRLGRTSPVKEIRRTPPFMKTTDNG